MIQGIVLEGAGELLARLEKIGGEIARKTLGAAMMEGAELIRKETVRVAPIRSTNLARQPSPGHLKRHIIKRLTRKPGIGGLTIVKVGPSKEAYYGYIVEIGSSRMRARPFLRPAFDSTIGAAQERIRASLASALKRI